MHCHLHGCEVKNTLRHWTEKWQFFLEEINYFSWILACYLFQRTRNTREKHLEPFEPLDQNFTSDPLFFMICMYHRFVPQIFQISKAWVLFRPLVTTVQKHWYFNIEIIKNQIQRAWIIISDPLFINHMEIDSKKMMKEERDQDKISLLANSLIA
jgi:hypothetical protein